MLRHAGMILGLVSLFLSDECLAQSGAAHPEWIWSTPKREAGRTVCLFTRFQVDGDLRAARLRGLADYAHAVFYVNGKRVGQGEPYGSVLTVDVAKHLQAGENSIGVCCRSVDGPAALFLGLTLEFDGGRRQTFVTNREWRAVETQDQHLKWPEVDKLKSSAATIFGQVARFPWGDATDTVTVKPLDDYTQWKQAQGTVAGTDPATFQLLPGFEIEMLRSAQQGEDSWIAMTFDPQGRLVVAKEKQGLLRFTLPGKSKERLQVETINDTLHECRGLLFTHGSLYAMANNDKALYRLRDTNGDDRFDEVRQLKSFEGTVGHGRNQIVLGPDGKIYCIFGDSVFEPEDADKLPPALAHPTAAEKTRSGFLARTDKDGKNWEVVTRGLRNPFGIAFNQDVEAFTYDADAEYDMGAPWYRPTRVDHLMSGADFGWRRVTKQWPPYFPDRPDMPQPTLDIGKGSPTAVAFGSGENFPAPYRDALFILDWAYGRILAVHLAPRGSSYAAKAESFLRGRPANVTDVAFGPDGAMYFVTGGRGTQSALYRVRYTGPKVEASAPTKQQLARQQHAARARALRRNLESYHGKATPGAIDKVWPHLGSDDPWIRHAARVAIEWQPVSDWREKALTETSARTALPALLALVRVGSASVHLSIVDRANDLTTSFERLSRQQQLETLQIFDRGLTSDGVPLGARNGLVGIPNPTYPTPDSSPLVNRRISVLGNGFPIRDFVSKTIPLLQRAENQQERMHYLFVLRDVEKGWTPTTRKIYFENLRRFDDFVGGDGMPTFRRLIETEALAAVPEGERQQYEDLLKARPNRWLAEIPQEPKPFVRKWKVADLSDSLAQLKSGRDFANGQRMFATAKCVACHRVGRRGSAVGPDLSAVSSRFRPADVLVSIIDPSRVVSAKYRSDIFVLNDGRTVTGRIVPGGDYRSPTLRVLADPLKPEDSVEFAKSAVELHKQSPVSPMPQGLLDHLTRDEILDLLAYINAAGDAKHPSFRE